MKKSNWIMRSFVIAAFIMMGSLFILPTSGTVSAHTMQSLHSNVPASQKCVGQVTITPNTLRVRVNSTATVKVSWSCEGGTGVIATISWGDGNTDNSYYCGVRCTDGNTTFQHIYYSKGTFAINASMGGFASGFASGTITVTS